MKQGEMRIVRRVFTAVLACSLCLKGINVAALGTYIPDQDTVATARGNAFVALANNPSAIFYNPAGISQLDGWNLSGRIYGVLPQASYNGQAGHAGTQNNIYLLPQFFLTWHPTNQIVSFGMGAYTPFGLGVDWGNNSVFRQVIIKNQLTYISYSAVVSFQITPDLSIGAGPTFSTANLQIEQGIAPVNLGDSAKFDGNGESYGGTLGVLWKATPQWSLGALYRGSSAVKYNGTFSVQPGALPIPVGTESANLTLNTPNQVSFGAGYEITTNWQMEADATWSQWSCLQNVTIVKNSGDVVQHFDWNDSWIVSLGTSYKLTHGYTLYGGFSYAQQSIPDSHFTPAIPDCDRYVLATGISKRFNRCLEASLAVQQVFGADRTIDNGITPPGTYSLNATAVTGSLLITF